MPKEVGTDDPFLRFEGREWYKASRRFEDWYQLDFSVGLRVFFENRTHDKRNHVLDFYHHQNHHGEERTDTKRLMRATVDESGKMNCTCPRLSNSEFMASRSGEVCLVFRASARQPGDPVEAAASALRKSLVKACPDEEQRMQAFYVKERQFAAREGQGAGVEVQPVMPVTSSTMRHVKPQSKKMSTTVERRGQLVHSSKRLN